MSPIKKGSKVIQPGDKEVRNVYEMLLNYLEELQDDEADNAIYIVETKAALEFVEGLL